MTVQAASPPTPPPITTTFILLVLTVASATELTRTCFAWYVVVVAAIFNQLDGHEGNTDEDEENLTNVGEFISYTVLSRGRRYTLCLLKILILLDPLSHPEHQGTNVMDLADPELTRKYYQ